MFGRLQLNADQHIICTCITHYIIIYQAFTCISGIYFAVFLQSDILIVPVDAVSGSPILSEEFHTTTFTVPALTVLLPKWHIYKLIALETIDDLLNSNFPAGIIRDSVAYKLFAGDVNSKYHLQ